MELPKEWREIAEWKPGTSGAAIDIVERCYALHTKPVRELTDSEICLAFDGVTTPYRPSDEWLLKIRAVIAAHQRKQQEPETVKLRLQTYLRSDGQFVALVDCEAANEMWTLVDSREIEVTLP